jgi:hypothetical protein
MGHCASSACTVQEESRGCGVEVVNACESRRALSTWARVLEPQRKQGHSAMVKQRGHDDTYA